MNENGSLVYFKNFIFIRGRLHLLSRYFLKTNKGTDLSNMNLDKFNITVKF